MKKKISFNWDFFLLENSYTQASLSKKIDRNKDVINIYVRNKYISVRMKARIEKILEINLNKYLNEKKYEKL